MPKTIDWNDLFEDLKDSVVGTIKEEAKAFLDQHKDAKDFVEERGKRLAELGVEYVKATDDAGRDHVLLQMKVVQQSIRNEISSVAVAAEAQARASFAKVVDTAVGVLLKALPVLVALI
jgi:hypothetical protein